MATLPTLTVSQLIELLQRMPQDLPTEVEGCDCAGRCVGVSVEADVLTLRRQDGVDSDYGKPIQTL